MSLNEGQHPDFDPEEQPYGPPKDIMPTPRRAALLNFFQDSQGNPLSLGYLSIRLNQDAQAPNGQICAGASATVQLGMNGQAVDAEVWPNEFLVPNTPYLVDAFTAQGQLVARLELIVEPGITGFGVAFGSSFAS